jgi:Cu/Ag efflux protein CusF
MKRQGNWINVVGLAGCLCLSSAAWAQASAAPAAPPKGEAVVASVDVTATVAKINHLTRRVTLKAADGSMTSFTVDPAVQNLDQVKKGDIVTATYTEALVYDVRKGGKPGAEQTTAAAAAPAGAKPAGAVVQSTTLTVSIAAIDARKPSITFKGPDGTKQTYKVASAEKLQGLKVGDTVDINYTEAIAIRVEKKPKK